MAEDKKKFPPDKTTSFVVVNSNDQPKAGSNDYNKAKQQADDSDRLFLAETTYTEIDKNTQQSIEQVDDVDLDI